MFTLLAQTKEICVIGHDDGRVSYAAPDFVEDLNNDQLRHAVESEQDSVKLVHIVDGEFQTYLVPLEPSKVGGSAFPIRVAFDARTKTWFVQKIKLACFLCGGDDAQGRVCPCHSGDICIMGCPENPKPESV